MVSRFAQSEIPSADAKDFEVERQAIGLGVFCAQLVVSFGNAVDNDVQPRRGAACGQNADLYVCRVKVVLSPCPCVQEAGKTITLPYLLEDFQDRKVIQGRHNAVFGDENFVVPMFKQIMVFIGLSQRVERTDDLMGRDLFSFRFN